MGSVRNDIFPSFTAIPRDFAVSIFPGFQLLDAAGPITAFEAAAASAAPGRQSRLNRSALPRQFSAIVSAIA
jgi:transcriptional regulator GlxA family with amidase domain